jgi:hypothetical protein
MFVTPQQQLMLLMAAFVLHECCCLWLLHVPYHPIKLLLVDLIHDQGYCLSWCL